jgi:hypothetical protein
MGKMDCGSGEVGKYEEEGDHILGDERRTEKEEEEEMSPKEKSNHQK